MQMYLSIFLIQGHPRQKFYAPQGQPEVLCTSSLIEVLRIPSLIAIPICYPSPSRGRTTYMPEFEIF